MRPRLESIRNIAEEGINEIRNMALLLRPSMLDDFGLVPALDWQARETAKRTGMHVQLTSELTDELPEEHKTCIYRVVQEALNNCARHAQASTVQVAVRRETGKILLSVQDDGSGFDHGARARPGFARHGGASPVIWAESFEVDSEPGRGTQGRGCLPLASLNGQHLNGEHLNGERGNGSNPHPAG